MRTSGFAAACAPSPAPSAHQPLAQLGRRPTAADQHQRAGGIVARAAAARGDGGEQQRGLAGARPADDPQRARRVLEHALRRRVPTRLRAPAGGRAARARGRALRSWEGCNHGPPTVPRADTARAAVAGRRSANPSGARKRRHPAITASASRPCASAVIALAGFDRAGRVARPTVDEGSAGRIESGEPPRPRLRPGRRSAGRWRCTASPGTPGAGRCWPSSCPSCDWSRWTCAATATRRGRRHGASSSTSRTCSP